VDFLLIAAVILVFVVNAATHHAHIGPHGGATPFSADVHERTSQPVDEPSLARAKIGVARMTRA
jgi:hypothetical protein